MEVSAATGVEDRIYRADNPDHFMKITPIAYPVEARWCDLTLGYSSQALLLQEVGRSVYAPVVYFPRQHVATEYLIESGKTSRCPLKGSAVYFDLNFLDRHQLALAWSYQQMLGFDTRLELIHKAVAFDAAAVQIIEHKNR
jgi:uncharacterized protein (DUF427 family)